MRGVAGQVLLLQVVVVAVAGSITAAVAIQDSRRDAEAASRSLVAALAYQQAQTATTVKALRSPSPETAAAVQAAGIDAVGGTRTDFFIVMDPDGRMISHPDPDMIGQVFAGPLQTPRAGGTVTLAYDGHLGPSVVALTPVREPGYGGAVIGISAVGIRQQRIVALAGKDIRTILGLMGVVFGVGAVGAVLIHLRLNRQTMGLRPKELARMYQFWDGVLHSVGDGLVVTDTTGNPALVNDPARAMLGTVDPLPEPIAELCARGRTVDAELVLLEDRLVVVDLRPATFRGRRLGSVLTLRDRTEVEALSDQLSAVEGFAQALQSQQHDAANTLQSVIALVELGQPEDAIRLAAEQSLYPQSLADQLRARSGDPVLVALILAKTAVASSRGIDLDVQVRQSVETGPLTPTDLVRLLGNLVDNALDAAASMPAPHRVRLRLLRQHGPHGRPELLIGVADSGPGMDPANLDRALRRGWSTKEGPRPRGLGLAIAAQVVRRHDGILAVDTSALGGAEFLVTIPVPVPGPVAGPPVPGATVDQSIPATVTADTGHDVDDRPAPAAGAR
jgi:two-component system CitB family sensor kinase